MTAVKQPVCNSTLWVLIQYLHPELCTVYFISVFMSCAAVCMSHPRAPQLSTHAEVWSHVCCGLLSYLAGPACWRSGCLSSGSGTSPSRPTWSEAGRGHGAHPGISDKKKENIHFGKQVTPNVYGNRIQACDWNKTKKQENMCWSGSYQSLYVVYISREKQKFWIDSEKSHSCELIPFVALWKM